LLWGVAGASAATDDGVRVAGAMISNAARVGGGATVCAHAFRLSTRQIERSCDESA
jgi:hypothetical protein